MSDDQAIRKVFVTGATGFVGQNVVGELLARGITPVCLVRSAGKLFGRHAKVSADRLVPVIGALDDPGALRECAEQSDAAIHLVGIIIERRLQGQTFRGVHHLGTAAAVHAAIDAGIKRFVHMSALGAAADATSKYHRTKWAGEQCVRDSGLAWTIFRPSLIHGPNGEFMRLMKKFICGLVPPFIPYFGSGNALLQPVSVKDVAHCMVESLELPSAIGVTYSLGGPRAYRWRDFYDVCCSLMPGARRWKPIVSQPVPVAKALALASAPLLALLELLIPSIGMMRFDRGQVDMSQEDSVCDVADVEAAFGIRMRDFEQELAQYAELIP